jgi:hypothetical protein
MKTLPTNNRLSIAVLAAVTFAAPVLAQDANKRVEQYACKDVMREGGSARDVAIAFLHGYLLGKTSQSAFNVETLQKQTDTFLDRCLSNPNEMAVEAMAFVKK